MLNRILSAIAPRDFVEQIWVHDLTNTVWDLFRWRRIESAYLAAKVSEERMLSIDHIRASVMALCTHSIERTEARVMTAQRRFDEIMRELHRHRFMQNQTRRLPAPESTQVEDDKPMIAGTLVTAAPHDQ
jgi:hypothetical protein